MHSFCLPSVWVILCGCQDMHLHHFGMQVKKLNSSTPIEMDEEFSDASEMSGTTCDPSQSSLSQYGMYCRLSLLVSCSTPANDIIYFLASTHSRVYIHEPLLVYGIQMERVQMDYSLYSHIWQASRYTDCANYSCQHEMVSQTVLLHFFCIKLCNSMTTNCNNWLEH